MGLLDLMGASTGGTMDDYMRQRATLDPTGLKKITDKIKKKPSKAALVAEAPKLPTPIAGPVVPVMPTPPVRPQLSDPGPATPEAIYGYLKEKGVPDAHAKGMLANAHGESGFDPAAVGDNGNAYGLFQHNGPRKAALFKHAGSSQPNWQQQLDYALAEPDTQKYLEQQFQDPAQATEWFTRKWERPANPDSDVAKRIAWLRSQGEGGLPVDTRMAGDDSNAGMPVPAVAPQSMDPEALPPMQQGFNPQRMPQISKDSGRARTLAMSGSKLGALSGLMFGYGADGYTMEERQQMAGQEAQAATQAGDLKHQRAMEIAKLRSQRAAGGAGAANQWARMNDGSLYNRTTGEVQKDPEYKTPAQQKVAQERETFADKELPAILSEAHDLAKVVRTAQDLGATGLIQGTLGKATDYGLEALGLGTSNPLGGAGDPKTRNWLRSKINRLGQEETLVRLGQLGGSDTEKEYKWLRETQANPQMMESQLDEWAWTYLELTAKALQKQGQDPSEIRALQEQFNPPTDFTSVQQAAPKTTGGKAEERADAFVY